MHSLFTVHSNLTSVSNSHFVNWNSAPGRSTPGVNVIPVPRVRHRKRTEAETACKKKMKTTKARDTESTVSSSTSGSRGAQLDRTTASVGVGRRNARKAVVRKSQYARSTPHTSVICSSSLPLSVPIPRPSSSLQPPVCDLPPAAWPGGVAGTFYDSSPIITSARERVMTDGVLADGIPPQYTRRRVPIQPHTMPPDIMFYHSPTSLPRPQAYGSQLHDTYRAVAQYSESTIPDPKFDAYGQLWRDPALPLPTHTHPSTALPVAPNVSAQMSPPYSHVDATAPSLIPPSPHSHVYFDFSYLPPSRTRHSAEIMTTPRTTFDERTTVAKRAPPDSDIWASAQVSKYSELIGATEVLGGAAYGGELVIDPYQYVAPDGQGSQGTSSIIDSGNEFGWPNIDTPGVFADAGDCENPATIQSGPSLVNGDEWRCQTSSLADALGGHGPVLPST